MKKVKSEFPGFRFHKEHEPKLVKSVEEASELGEGWGAWAEIFGKKVEEKPTGKGAAAEVPDKGSKPDPKKDKVK